MPEVEVTRDGAVLTVTLNRPEVLNALNRAVHRGLHDALRLAAEDSSVRAVVITGAGRGFCVGQDLQEFSDGAGDVAQNLRDNYHRNVLAIRALEKPVIAAVNGAAAGAGMSLALACDLRVAAASASFVPAFIKIGLVPDSGGTWLVRRLLGAARAFEWLTTGRRLAAEEARALGLVAEVVPDEELAARALELARLYAAMPTRAVWQTKRLLDAAETSTFAEQLELEAAAQAELVRTPDFREGVAAFLGKRDAAFTGGEAPAPHPVRLVVTDDLRRWRLTTALRPLLALPHLAVLALWQLAVLPVVAVSWAILLVRGRPSERLHGWLASLVRYFVHVHGYAYLVGEPFPSFRPEAPYPVDVVVPPPGPQPRWSTALRILLAVPAFVFASVLSVVLGAVSAVAAVAALALGRAPRGLRDLSAYCVRYDAQLAAYLYLLTDRYPTLAGSR